MQPDNVHPRQAGTSGELRSLIGKSLGQYRIVDRIGAGGMAMVFKAYQSTLDRYVAVKVLPATQALDPVFVKRFVQEARSVAKLAHPNIVQIHDFGQDSQEDITYIVMEYVDGGTLKERLTQPLLVPEAVDFVIQAAEGLDCAHRNGIIHRDVKPANMLLRKDGHLLLSDFGIAKILEETTSLTRVGTGIGTPQYMSPEQGSGQPVDRRSDLYSLGIVLFHCLTGKVPFVADNPLTVTMKHIKEPFPIARLLETGVPDPIVQVVKKMTEKQAQERYQTAGEVVQALTSALAAANFSMPRLYRANIPPLPSYSGVDNVGPSGPVSSGAGYNSTVNRVSNPSYPSNPPYETSAGGITCFRCRAVNPGSRVYCTSCGYELADSLAVKDSYMVNGRPMQALLTMTTGPAVMRGRSYRFHQVVTIIGRTNVTGNSFIVPGLSVSRRHARLFFSEGHWYLEDVGSSNGTRVNGVRIFQYVELIDGDIINFGDEVVVFNIIYD
jgi:serine/threonine protein kinase